MVVVVTGSSDGLGKAVCHKFLSSMPDCVVYGLDIKQATIHHNRYYHFVCDVSNWYELPDIANVSVLVNNAALQTESYDYGVGQKDIDVNLLGTINCTNKYLNPDIKSIINVCSVCAHTGADFPYYVASKGGILSYTKYMAIELAKYGATCNSISHGATHTEMNKHILDNQDLLEACYDQTLLKRWSDVEEIAEWVYFIGIINKSMTGQDVIIDNGETTNFKFIW